LYMVFLCSIFCYSISVIRASEEQSSEAFFIMSIKKIET